MLSFSSCTGSRVNLVIGLLVVVFGLLYFSINFNISAASSSTVFKKSGDDYPIDLWFMSIKDHTGGHIAYAKQAILSARDNTDLIPILILDGKDDNLEKWMVKHNVYVVHVENHPVMKYLRDAKLMESEAQGIATWQRIVIPHIIKQMTVLPNGYHNRSRNDTLNTSFVTNVSNSSVMLIEGRSHPFWGLPSVYQNRTIRADYVLYTDADVMFLKPFKISQQYLPRYVGMAIQGDRYQYGKKFEKQMHSNAGVLVMNVSGYAEAYDEFVNFIKRHAAYIKTNALDQTALQGFFPQRLKSLSVVDYLELALFHSRYYRTLSSKYHANTLPKVYEWEPYLGPNKDAVLIHWHGIKYYTPEQFCPGPGKDFEFSMVPPGYDHCKIRSFLNLTNFTGESLKPFKVLLQYDPHLSKAGLTEYSEMYLKYMRKVCESDVGLRRVRW